MMRFYTILAYNHSTPESNNQPCYETLPCILIRSTVIVHATGNAHQNATAAVQYNCQCPAHTYNTMPTSRALSPSLFLSLPSRSFLQTLDV